MGAIRTRVQRSALDDLRVRAGQEVAHLSYRRLTKPPATRQWKIDVIPGVIGNAFRLFLDHVDSSLLCSDFEARLRATWPSYLNAPIAMSFPPDCDAVPAITVACETLQDLGSVRQATYEEMLPKLRR